MLFSQMMPGMEWLPVFALLVVVALILGIVVAAFLLFRWIIANNFGFIVQHRDDGTHSVRISLRNLMIWVAVIPPVIGFVAWCSQRYSQSVARIEKEKAAERLIESVGGDVWRYEALIPIESEEVFWVMLENSSVGSKELVALRDFPSLNTVTIGESQMRAEILSAIPPIKEMRVQDASLDSDMAQLLVKHRCCDSLCVYRCIVTPAARRILQEEFGKDLHMNSE